MDAGFEISELGGAVSKYAGAKIASVASGAVDKAQDTANAAVEGLVNSLNQEMQEFIGGGIDKIYNSLGLSEENLQLAKTIINATGGAVAKVASIISVIPVDISMVPSVKETLSPMCTSIKEVAWGIYKDMMFQYHQMMNLVMRQLANPTELLCAVVMVVVEEIEKRIDEQCYKYTGYHILEIYNMCVTGIQLFNTIKNLARPKVPEGSAGYEVDVDVNTQVALKQEAMQRLNAYMETLSVPLRNAFMMIQLKETVMEVKTLIQRFSLMGTSLMSMKINSLEDVLELLNSMMGEHPHIITLTDVIENAINNSVAAAASVMDAVNAAKNNVGILTDGLTKEAAIAGVVGSIDISASKTWEIKMDSGKTDADKTGATHYNLDIYKNPNKLLNPLTKVLRKIQVGGAQVLPNTEISKFLDSIKVMYSSGNNAQDITLYGKVEGQRRAYIFHVAITAEPEPSEDSQTTSPDKLQGSDNNNSYGSLAEYITSKLEDEKQEQLKDDQPVIFDIVELLIKMLMPMIEVLQQIAKLMENYRINKAKCMAHARGNLHISLSDILEKSGLAKLMANEKDNTGSSDDNKPEGPLDGNESNPDGSKPSSGDSGADTEKFNFYTVRTYAFNNWLSVHFGLQPLSNRTARIEAVYTARIVSECANLINVSELNPKLATVLYFDSDSIAEDRRVNMTGDTRNGPFYKDGTMNGLDGVEKDIYTGDIYISDGRSTETSEIYRCIKKKYNPTK